LLRDGLTRGNSIAYVCGIPGHDPRRRGASRGPGVPGEADPKQLCWPEGKEPKLAKE